MKNSVFSRVLALGISFSVVFIASPSIAEASVMSFMTSVFGGVQAAETQDNTNIENSQKMQLLEAPVNSSVHAKLASDIVVQGGALVADSVSSDNAVDLQTSQGTNQITTYVVQSGDTISEIAQKFGISINTIIWSNNLARSNSIRVGQKLVILPISGVQHKVQSGDTILSIAKKYKGDVDDIKKYNNIDGDFLKIGDLVVVPDGVLPSTSGASQSNTTARSTRSNIPASFYIRPIRSGVRTQGIHGNNGIDLANSCGTSIYASASGNVIVSRDNGGWNGGYGNYVVISHSNGSQTLYSHMKSAIVSEGDYVSQGQLIGYIGATGKVHGVTGCHVHFEIRNGPVNPF